MSGVPLSDECIVVVITTGPADGDELRSERYVAASIGEALDAHAPDPAAGARFVVECVGRARSVTADQS